MIESHWRLNAKDDIMKLYLFQLEIWLWVGFKKGGKIRPYSALLGQFDLHIMQITERHLVTSAKEE